MPPSSQSVYLRTLARLESGRVRGGSEHQETLAKHYFGEDVEVLGTYLTRSGVPAFLITSMGVVVAADEQCTSWRAVPYQSIERVEMPSGVDTKMEQGHLALKLLSGEYVDLCVDGGTQKTRDVFEVCRFLMRVTTG